MSKINCIGWKNGEGKNGVVSGRMSASSHLSSSHGVLSRIVEFNVCMKNDSGKHAPDVAPLYPFLSGKLMKQGVIRASNNT